MSLPERIHRLVDSSIPLFNTLRWLLEAGYLGETAVLRNEGCLDAQTVLDLGCGPAVLTRQYEVTKYFGVDINSRYIEWAIRKNPGYCFEQMDVRRLRFNNASFDCVVIGGVLHHLDDGAAREVLAEVRRVLKPDQGRLVLWEDVPTRSRWNGLGHLIHKLDEGDYIREEEHYLKMVRQFFGTVKHYPMASGVCDYLVAVAQ